MKKVLALACAASAFALISSAHATESTGYTVNLSGHVDGFCKFLGLTSGGNPVSGPTVIADFAGADGIVPTKTIAGELTIAANRQCTVTVGSAKGGLQNGNTAYKVNYSVGFSGKTFPATVSTNFINEQFTLVSAGTAVPFNFIIAGSAGAVVLAGDYTDVVTIAINPT